MRRVAVLTTMMVRRSHTGPRELASILPKRRLPAEESTQDTIDWNRAMDVIKRTEADQLPQLRPDKAQLHEQLAVLNPTYSLTTLVNESDTLRKLVDLGVDLSQWESRCVHSGASNSWPNINQWTLGHFKHDFFA